MAWNQRGTCVKQKGQCGLLRAKWNNFISGGVEQPQITALVLSKPFCGFSLPGHSHWEPLPSPAPQWGPCSSALCRAQCWAAALQTPEHLRRGNEWFLSAPALCRAQSWAVALQTPGAPQEGKWVTSVCSCLLLAESRQVKLTERHFTAPNAVIRRQMFSAFWSSHAQSCDQPVHPFSSQPHPSTAPCGGCCRCWGDSSAFLFFLRRTGLSVHSSWKSNMYVQCAFYLVN